MSRCTHIIFKIRFNTAFELRTNHEKWKVDHSSSRPAKCKVSQWNIASKLSKVG